MSLLHLLMLALLARVAPSALPPANLQVAPVVVLLLAAVLLPRAMVAVSSLLLVQAVMAQAVAFPWLRVPRLLTQVVS